METDQGDETLVSKVGSDRSGQRGRQESVMQGFVKQCKDFRFFSRWNGKSLRIASRQMT